jgi:hypothetical protein
MLSAVVGGPDGAWHLQLHTVHGCMVQCCHQTHVWRKVAMKCISAADGHAVVWHVQSMPSTTDSTHTPR